MIIESFWYQIGPSELLNLCYNVRISFSLGKECDVCKVEVVYPGYQEVTPQGLYTVPDVVVGYTNRDGNYPLELQKINFPLNLGPSCAFLRTSVPAYTRLYDKNGNLICEHVYPLYFARGHSEGDANEEPAFKMDSMNNNLKDLYCVPNPATESTDITLNLNEKANIQIVLSNIIGDRVSSIYMTGVKGLINSLLSKCWIKASM